VLHITFDYFWQIYSFVWIDDLENSKDIVLMFLDVIGDMVDVVTLSGRKNAGKANS
jgi:hypothetical protein